MKKLLQPIRRLSISLALCLALTVPGSVMALDKPVPGRTLALFMPRFPGDTFWDLVASFMQAACRDLGLELQIHYGQDSAERYKQLVRQAVQGPGKVDGVVFQNFKETAAEILEIANAARVPALIIDTSLADKDRERLGKPREKLPFWVGEFVPDNEEAGFDLANRLADLAKPSAPAGGRIQMLAIAGETDEGSASFPRVKGLKIAVQNRSDILLHQVRPAFWQQEQARKTLLDLYARYPGTTVVWAANDPMSLGAAAGIAHLKLIPGRDMVTGGIDWTADALKALQKGDMSASVGGHFMLGGWAAVLLFDYFHGFDFAEESVEMRLRMDILSRDNIGVYLRHFGQGKWDAIDFTRFSKARNPGLQKYDFGLKAILQQL